MVDCYYLGVFWDGFRERPQFRRTFFNAPGLDTLTWRIWVING